MKSYLSLIPISARVRRRQNRLTILCIVTAVFLVTAIFSVADMMLRTQTGRAAGKSGSWHLEVTGITPEQAAQLVGQPDVVRVGAGAVFNENGEKRIPPERQAGGAVWCRCRLCEPEPCRSLCGHLTRRRKTKCCWARPLHGCCMWAAETL